MPASASPLDGPIARAVLAIVLLAVLGGGFYALTRGNSDDAPPSATGTPVPGATEAALGALDDRAPIIGQPAPDFALRSPDGVTTTLSDLKGNVVFVNFWATWCEPCKKELPDIEQLYEERRADGLRVLAVNYDERASDAAAFFSSRKIDLPMLLDSDGEVYRQYRLQGLPDSFFIDREGNVAAIYYGFLTPERMRDKLADAGLP